MRGLQAAMPYTYRVIEGTWTQNCCSPTPFTELTFRLPGALQRHAHLQSWRLLVGVFGVGYVS